MHATFVKVGGADANADMSHSGVMVFFHRFVKSSQLIQSTTCS